MLAHIFNGLVKFLYRIRVAFRVLTGSYFQGRGKPYPKRTLPLSEKPICDLFGCRRYSGRIQSKVRRALQEVGRKEQIPEMAQKFNAAKTFLVRLDAMAQYVDFKNIPIMEEPSGMKRGRKLGGHNKPKLVPIPAAAIAPVAGHRDRPKGSKNKPNIMITTPIVGSVPTAAPTLPEMVPEMVPITISQAPAVVDPIVLPHAEVSIRPRCKLLKKMNVSVFFTARRIRDTLLNLGLESEAKEFFTRAFETEGREALFKLASEYVDIQ